MTEARTNKTTGCVAVLEASTPNLLMCGAKFGMRLIAAAEGSAKLVQKTARESPRNVTRFFCAWFTSRERRHTRPWALKPSVSATSCYLAARQVRLVHEALVATPDAPGCKRSRHAMARGLARSEGVARIDSWLPQSPAAAAVPRNT